MSDNTSHKALTHDRILDVAARAISRTGFDGVGLASFVKEAGPTHGGFHAHLASRDSVGTEATQQAGRDTGAVLVERLRQAQADGTSPFSALANTHLADAQRENTECGCMVGALPSLIPRQAEDVASSARAQVPSLVELVHRNRPAGVDPEQAQVPAATLVGTLQLARTSQGKAGFAHLHRVRGKKDQQVMTAPPKDDLPHPYIADAVDRELVGLGDGHADIQATPQLKHYNLLGTVRGGGYATLMDFAFGCAVQSKLPAGRSYTTSRINPNIVRAVSTMADLLH